jgi:putative hydrolase of the HAD superfamily
VFDRHAVTPERALMAGDSMRSDILPALSAGAFAAHIPHAMPWAHEMADEPADHPRFRKLERLGEVVEWIDSL